MWSRSCPAGLCLTDLLPVRVVGEQHSHRPAVDTKRGGAHFTIWRRNRPTDGRAGLDHNLATGGACCGPEPVLVKPTGRGGREELSAALVPRSGQTVFDAFWRGSDGAIRETWYNWANGRWGGWIPIGSASLSSDPQAAATSDGPRPAFAGADTPSGVFEGGVGGAAGAAARAGPLLRGAEMAGGELSVLAAGTVSAEPAAPIPPPRAWAPMWPSRGGRGL